MALPVVIPNTFANANASIPLSQLDNNFSTVAVAINGMANGAESLSNVNITGGSIANASLSNVSISSGNVTINVANVTTLDATNVEVTNIKAKDGTASATIADSTGVMTIASSVLTTADINGGTIDNAAIGATTPSTGAFTTLTTSSTVTLNGGTANGVAYLDGSKVLTTGSALVFDGTSLGIGTSSPLTKFDVTGTSGVGINLSNSSDSLRGGRLIATGSAGTGTFQIGTTSAGYSLTFAIDLVEKMRLDSSGNLGLGVTPSTSNAGRTFELNTVGNQVRCNGINDMNVESNTYYNSGFKYASTGTATRYAQSSGQHQWHTAASGTAGNAISFTQAMTLDASGNLGIGTTSPYNNASFTSLSIGGSKVGFIGLNNASGTMQATIDTFNNQFRIGTNGTSNPIVFNTGGSVTEAMRIDSSGNVGIGTSSPSAPLDVNGNVAITGSARRITGDFSNATLANRLMFQTSTTNANSNSAAIPNGTGTAAAWMVFNNSDPTNSGYGEIRVTSTDVRLQSASAGTGTALPMTFYTGGSERMRLDTSGNVGIGTSSPGYKLDVVGTIATTYSTTVKGGFTASSSSVFVSALTNHPLIFETNGTERARITSAGELLVGGTNVNPWADTTGTGTTAIWKNRLFVSSDSDCGAFNRIGSDGTIYSFNRSGSGVGTISVTTTATAYNTSSDYRLKNVTGPIKNSGAYIDSLNPVEGTWKADGSPFVGLIAHEVQEVSRTQVVTGEKDGEEMQGMDYSNAEIIANLIAEVKSLRSRIAALEAK